MSAKRDLDSTIRAVSPPARRRKLSTPIAAREVDVERPAEPSSGLIKIVSWNVNGVGPFFQRRISAPRERPLRNKLENLGWPHLCCLQEVKINSKDVATQRRLQVAANEGSRPGEPTYEIVYSLPRDPHNARGFGGKVHGVASLARWDFCPSIQVTRRPDWDLEGRILIHETAMRLVIINGYWINGTSAPWRNSSGKPEGTRHDLKLRYHARILNEVLDYQKQGFHVLLVGDMNVALDERDGHPNLRVTPEQHVKNRKDFNRKFFRDTDGMQGVDVFRHFHGDERKYTYHSPSASWGISADRVDHIVASRSLVADFALVNSDICDTKKDAEHSDHVPLWVTIDSSKLNKPEQMERLPEKAQDEEAAGNDTFAGRDSLAATCSPLATKEGLSTPPSQRHSSSLGE